MQGHTFKMQLAVLHGFVAFGLNRENHSPIRGLGGHSLFRNGFACSCPRHAFQLKCNGSLVLLCLDDLPSL